MWRSLLMMMAVFCAPTSAGECERRWYGYSSYVCVCNATYCDAPEPLLLDTLSSNEYVMYTSSMDGGRLQYRRGNFSRPPRLNNPPDVASLLVNVSDQRQEVVGFGGAMTDASAINIASLSPDAQQLLMRSYFSPEGSWYSFLRVPIGGTDFSTHMYTYDDDVPGDTSLQNFALAPEDLQLKIPYLKWAANLTGGQLNLLASPWSAPQWAKERHRKRLRPIYYQYWADYIVRFLDAYAAEGVHLWGMTGQNEPVLGAQDFTLFNSMGWTPREASTWYSDNLVPSLRRAGYGHLKLITLDDQRGFVQRWVPEMFANDTVRDIVSGVSVHWYFDHFTDPNILSQILEDYPEKIVLYTEASDGAFMSPGPSVQPGSWERGENFTTRLIQAMNHGASSWIDWNLALNMVGGPTWASNAVDAAILVNSSADEFYKQPSYYSLSHFSTFVRPGSRVLGSSSSGRQGIEQVAYLTPQHAVVLVLQNRLDEDIVAVITDPSVGSIQMTVPSRSKHTIIYKCSCSE